MPKISGLSSDPVFVFGFCFGREGGVGGGGGGGGAQENPLPYAVGLL